MEKIQDNVVLVRTLKVSIPAMFAHNTFSYGCTHKMYKTKMKWAEQKHRKNKSNLISKSNVKSKKFTDPGKWSNAFKDIFRIKQLGAYIAKFEDSIFMFQVSSLRINEHF